MAWRFKASKYKNAAPVVPKPENYVRDICVGSYQTYGNNIAASAKFMAFNWEHAGSSLAVLPLDDSGRKGKLMPLLHAHSDTVTDLEFSPFHDGLLVTGSQDCLMKVWHIPEKGLLESLSDPEAVFSHKQRRVETVGFHPVADFLLHSTSSTGLTLWDLMAQQEIFTNSDSQEVIQSVTWKRDGTLLATSSKDKKVRIIDPRAKTPCLKTAQSHQSIKDSRIVWLGDSNRVLTTGFDSQRLRQIMIRDLRNFGPVEKSLELDCSTGILIPLYDPDTGMLFLAGKGDTTIGYMEVSDKEPYLIEGIRHSGEQTKGACLVPKRALNVMQGEVNRILQLTGSSVVPVTYQVPRKTYRDFHADLYPDTPGCRTELTAQSWMQGKDLPVPKISLDPAKREQGEEPIIVHRGPLSKLQKDNQQSSQNEDHKIVIEIKSPPNKSSVTMAPTTNVKTFVPKVTATVPKNDVFGPCIRDVSDIILKDEQSPTRDNKDEEDDKNKKNVAAVIEQNNKINVSMEEDDGGSIIPPKPLPRTSRAGSVCDNLIGPTDDGNCATKPVARPRTNSVAPIVTTSVTPVLTGGIVGGGYKPRLGPKPFTPLKLNEAESFDKVFSVPAVPGNTQHQPQQHSNGIAKNDALDVVENVLIEEESNPQPDIENGDDDKSPDELVTPPKTPSTADRRRLFESTVPPPTTVAPKDNETVPANFEEQSTNNSFERSSLQRSSIAERRRMYENRSQSVVDGGAAVTTVAEKSGGSPVLLRRKDSLKNNASKDNSRPVTTKQVSLDHQGGNKNKGEVALPTPKRTSTVFGRVSKFRHLKGTPAHKSFHIENVRNLSRQISGECDGFHANPERVAVPLSGPGGKIAIFELAKTGKLPDGVIPTLVQGSNIMDFAWDPFNNYRLAVACDDGTIKVWRIPQDGLQEPTNEPEFEFNAHSDKIYFIKFHPLACNVLASGSYDMTLKIWDLEQSGDNKVEKILLRGHTDQMFSFAWSPCGVYCATVSKDSKIRVYKPRASAEPMHEGKGPVGSRGARIVWALDGNFIVVMGFDKVSERQIMVFKATDLDSPLNVVGLDVSPAILIPFYDEDSSTLFLTGKGDSTIYAFEITEESPYICALSHHRCNNLHQGLSFLGKNVCDVAAVEFAKALRLTNNSIEPLSFTVPRIKTELFQDDLFPPTRMLWEPTLESSEWFAGKDKTPKRLNLKPDGMDSLTNATNCADNSNRTINKSASTPFIGASQPFNRLGWNAEMSGQTKIKQEEIQKSVSTKMEVNLKLEQDEMEGVDEREWND